LNLFRACWGFVFGDKKDGFFGPKDKFPTSSYIIGSAYNLQNLRFFKEEATIKPTLNIYL